MSSRTPDHRVAAYYIHSPLCLIQIESVTDRVWMLCKKVLPYKKHHNKCDLSDNMHSLYPKPNLIKIRLSLQKEMKLMVDFLLKVIGSCSQIKFMRKKLHFASLYQQ